MVQVRSVMLVAVALHLAGCRGVLGIEDPVVRADASPGGVDGPGQPDAPSVTDALGEGDAAPVGPRLVHLGHWGSDADVSTYTFDAVPLGAATLGRHVIVISHGRSPVSAFGAATVTIGAGPSATRVIMANEFATGGTTAVHIAAVPDGLTSAAITLSFAGGLGDRRAAIGVWVADGLSSAAPFDVAAVEDGTNVVPLALDLRADGVFVAGASIGTLEGITPATWAGADEQYEVVVATTLTSGAAGTSAAAEVRALTFSAADNSIHVVAASFR